jgi:hypothetical protein
MEEADELFLGTNTYRDLLRISRKIAANRGEEL